MADRLRRIRLIPLLAVLVVGCQFLPGAGPAVTCVDVDQAVCEREVARVIEEARRMQPPKRIVSIRIADTHSGHVEYDDGTSMSWMP